MERVKSRRWLATLLTAVTVALTLSAATTDGQVPTGNTYRVINEVDTVWNFGIKGINLYSRGVHRIDIAYPSKDAQGTPVELSGCVVIPADLYNGEQPVDGILLYNHFTQLSYDGAPTRGNAEGEDYLIANPLRPNYIVVESDFYGFGITEGHRQYFCYGTANGQASIDCLLAARRLLDDRGISQGRLLLNAGYSAGGYDAIGAQKVRDMYYSDQIRFDKTLVGDCPFDMDKAYSTIIDEKDDTALRLYGVLMALDSYNIHGNLGLDLKSMMNEPLASNFDEWLHSGKYTTETLKETLKDMSASQLLKDTLLNYKSPVVKMLKEAMKSVALVEGWTPDKDQNYFVFSLFRDNTVPVGSCRAFINYLSNYYYDDLKDKNPLFKKSIIPEQTHLQTNFFINSSDHLTLGSIVFYLNLVATMAAMPVLYYDGELNTHYADLVADFTPMGIIKKLEASGIDVKRIVKEQLSGEGSSGGLFGLIASLDEKLAPLNLTSADVLQIADDSGLSLIDIIQIYQYLTTDDDSAAAARGATATEQKAIPGTPDYYLNYLHNWLKENKVNIYDGR